MQREMLESEKLKISVFLEDYHACFYQFFEMSSISFTDEIPTACVKFYSNSKPDLLLNEDFWNSKTLREQLFIICHECLHVLLDHGIRNARDVEGSTSELVNIAQDITINEMIVDLFNFDREEITGWKNFCWIDTCFKNPVLIKRNETFYYYLNELIKDPIDSLPSLVDQHIDLESEAEKETQQRVAKQIAQSLNVNELEQIINGLPENEGAGSQSSIYDQIISKKLKNLKIDFKKLIKKLKRTSIKEIPVDVETFTHDDRRFGNVLCDPRILLPGKAELMKPDKDRLLSAIFMDVSGSCISYLNVFNQVINEFELEKDLFDVKLFTFDTKVIEISKTSRIRVGGGTSFSIIEDRCREIENELGRYPDCVIVITDGEGNRVDPKVPSKWIWLLTKGGVKTFIHSKSRSFFISQVTF